ncbi:DUF2306 domain-containing protein [Arthrobacter sp. VKM Ac-2550]|uniref:DUF2306 domain-containing protein n=1 Tax=Crystallibacter permensis TaxID=1938888 RepID=UPI0022262A62|nr:DUF2306 domain-containing protein [Arthrobacter sp. VKM Ac-2550]MCW2135193.1 putative membrane protein (DUF2306) [Arthrobacter sp. VKM Ac-2550]
MNASRKTATVVMGTETKESPRGRRGGGGQWLVPAALIFVSLIPVFFGTARLAELMEGAEVTPANHRFFDSPIPVLIHIPAAIVYSLVGAFQFVPSLRRGKRGKRGKRSWHRVAGKVLIPAGLLVALSGLWMAVFYDLPPSDGELLLVFRLVFGSAMVASIVMGILAIRRRDFAAHGAWMARGYAIGIAAGTQALVSIPWLLLVGPADVLTRALLLGSAWVINLAVAEYFIHRRTRRPARTNHPSGSLARPAATASL